MQLLDALSLAHAKEVIHRDIKPANVLITRNGVVKLTDFGLAKQRTEPSSTSPGIAVGTVFYMPPEQVRGLGDIDWRADLYAVGVVLYEMLTGRKPFDGPEHFTVMRAHMEFEPPPPSSLVPYLPPSVDAVVSRALQKDAANRFQSAAEFLIALRQLTSAPSAPPQPAAVPARSTSWRLSLPLSAAAVILLLAAFAMPRFDWREESLVLPLPSPPAGPSDPVLAAVPRQASEASEPLPPASIKPKDRPRPLSPPSARPSPSQANAATKPFHASRILNAEKPELETPKLVEVTGAHPSVPQAPLVATPPPAVQSTPAPGVPSKPVIEPALPADRPAGWVRRTFGRWFRKEAPKQTPDKP
jgi:serine/threonine-protein kinase